MRKLKRRTPEEIKKADKKRKWDEMSRPLSLDEAYKTAQVYGKVILLRYKRLQYQEYFIRTSMEGIKSLHDMGVTWTPDSLGHYLRAIERMVKKDFLDDMAKEDFYNVNKGWNGRRTGNVSMSASC